MAGCFLKASVFWSSCWAELLGIMQSDAEWLSALRLTKKLVSERLGCPEFDPQPG